MDFGKVAQEAGYVTKEKSKAKPGLLPGSLVVMPLDVLKAQVKAEEVSLAMDRSMAAVKELVVIDQESAARCIDIAAGAKKAAKSIDMALKAAIKDPEDRIKEARGFAKLFTDRAAVIESEAKGKVAAWQASERIRIQKEEAEKRRIAEEATRKLQEEAIEAGMAEAEAKQIKVEMPTAPTTAPVLRTEGGAKSSTAMVWVFEIEDPAKVPDEYKMIDEKKVRDAVRMGTREIAGIRIFQKEQIRIG
jgi:hypothetical protein